MQKVKLKEIDVKEVDTVEEYIMKFYENLGWDGKVDLEPTNIKINKKKWEEICEQLIKRYERWPSFVWMNKGPSASQEVPEDEVWVSEKWCK